MNYVSTLIEDTVEELYLKMGIVDPDHSIEDIAQRLGIQLYYFRKPPFVSRGCIYLDPAIPLEKRKEVFSHELAHILYHSGVQLFMTESFRLLQESQADNFALHFAVPTFMLRELVLSERNQAITSIASTFHVTHNFAAKRLNHYEKQIEGLILREKINSKMENYYR
ncbi:MULTISPECIES: ImmA/IrrE family metallo-endopeptidase [Lentibacillus]|uniref:IrrE N-terminal-like domain-containing protein n=1 Tax=Lentibacillus persicus TaxID=640948 RepID=A0A1I2B4S3_9BACI|nr:MULTISPECIES: ImmA/IrrE family metallo-endopeptidase [Lentibacillus]SFE50898.1 protein of unknown function [Lentibacillus persicus]HLS08140.1 ImmA/IrrE family metallo-endopeptidase [Lentibacillus sp.]